MPQRRPHHSRRPGMQEPTPRPTTGACRASSFVSAPWLTNGRGREGKGLEGLVGSPASLGRKGPDLSVNSPISIPCPTPGLFLPKGIKIPSMAHGLREFMCGHRGTLVTTSDGWGCSLQPGLGDKVTRSKHACHGVHLILIWLLWCARCRRCSGGQGTNPYMQGEISTFGSGRWGWGWRGSGDMGKERSPHILVSIAPFGCFPEESWDKSVSWFTFTSPFPPCSSLGQKGRFQVQKEGQNLESIPQGRP